MQTGSTAFKMTVGQVVKKSRWPLGPCQR